MGNKLQNGDFIFLEIYFIIFFILLFICGFPAEQTFCFVQWLSLSWLFIFENIFFFSEQRNTKYL